MSTILANLCFVGAFLFLGVGTLGLFRMPDIYARLQTVALGDTLGVGLTALGLLMLTTDRVIRIKLIMLVAIFWIINPTIAHLVAKASLVHGVDPTAEIKVEKGEGSWDLP